MQMGMQNLFLNNRDDNSWFDLPQGSGGWEVGNSFDTIPYSSWLVRTSLVENCFGSTFISFHLWRSSRIFPWSLLFLPSHDTDEPRQSFTHSQFMQNSSATMEMNLREVIMHEMQTVKNSLLGMEDNKVLGVTGWQLWFQWWWVCNDWRYTIGRVCWILRCSKHG